MRVILATLSAEAKGCIATTSRLIWQYTPESSAIKHLTDRDVVSIWAHSKTKDMTGSQLFSLVCEDSFSRL